MNHKIQYKDFLKTFTEKQRDDLRDYSIVMELHKNGYSRKDILNKIDISFDKLHQWRNTSIRPIPIKILDKAHERGYFEQIPKRRSEDLAYLIGFNLGDGNISRNLCNTWFYGVNSDLEKVKEIFIQFSVIPVIYTYKINNGKMAIHDHVFSRLLVCCGAVIGDKTTASYGVPSWILKSGKASVIKRRFLQGFFDSELSDMKLERNRTFAYKSMKLYASKQFDYVGSGITFLNQIRSILTEFKVYSSEVKLDRAYHRIRDDNNMQQLFFIIYSNHINLYNFIRNVGFLYNSKRRENSMRNLAKIKIKAESEIMKIKKYDEAIKLRKSGLSAYAIADKLNIDAYHIKNWIYFERKPMLYEFVQSRN